MKTISVIMPAYNSLELVLRCLNSLRATAAHGEAVEYLVQDDASPEVYLPELVPVEVAKTHRNEYNMGFAPNANAGAGHASGDILFFVNQDVFAKVGYSNGWDAALRRVFTESDTGIAGPLLLFPDGRVQSAGGLFDGALQPYHPCLGWSDVTHPEIATGRPVKWVTGAALAIRRDLWDKLGGFDTVYERGYFEDVDLCCRARQANEIVRYTPAVRLFHSVGSTGGSPLFMKNALTFKTRWVNTVKVKPDVPTLQVRYWA